ncbi:MAG: CynX/NimT family MFS transporter [Candidatus Methylomirabilia bacterium]
MLTNRWTMLALIFFTRIWITFQFQSIPPVAPFLIDEFGLSYSQIGLLTGLFMLPGALIAVPGGMLGQRFADRRLVLCGLALMIVGGMTTAQSTGFVLAGVGRTVSGIGGVLLNIFLAKMVADWFAGKELSTAMGIMLTSWPVGIALALASLGALASASSWRVAIHATVIPSAIALALMLLLYRDPPRPSEAPAGRGWRSLTLSRRDLTLSASAGLAWSSLTASSIVFVSFAPGFLIAGGASIVQAGLLASLPIWVRMASVPLGGYVADRIGKRELLIVVGCLATALFMLLIPVVPAPVLWFVLIGIAGGASPSAIMSLVPQAVKPEHLATALGFFYTIFYLGVAVAQPLAGLTRDLSGNPAMPVLFAAALMVLPVVALGICRSVQRRPPGQIAA